MPVITNIEDLRVLAEKRVPRMFYDYADSGSWTEGTYRANSEDFQKIKLRQRVAVNMENRTTATTMVGQAVKMRFCAIWVTRVAVPSSTTNSASRPSSFISPLIWLRSQPRPTISAPARLAWRA